MAKSTIMGIRLSVENDKALIEKVCSASSISAYIKSLIAKDIGLESNYDFSFSPEAKAIPSGGNLHISLNPKTEAEIITKLNSVYNKSDYVRTLVMDDMNSGRSKSFDQLSAEIDLTEYTDLANFTATRFSELSELLRKNGYVGKASECNKISELLFTWSKNTR